MPTPKNKELAQKLFPLMHQAGKDIICETATADSVANHIQEILTLGYDGKIHERFSDFIKVHFKLINSDYAVNPGKLNPTKKLTCIKTLRYVGTILVDWVVLEAARKLTTNERIWIIKHGNYTREDFLARLPFTPPSLDLSARPYTPVAQTFWALGHTIGTVEHLANSEALADIFDKILLWKTYYKEPFHDYLYGEIRSIKEYREFRRQARE